MTHLTNHTAEPLEDQSREPAALRSVLVLLEEIIGPALHGYV